MDQARPTRKLLDWRPMGTRPVGRPKMRWLDDMSMDLRKMGLNEWKDRERN
jgi:hypothetical protein